LADCSSSEGYTLRLGLDGGDGFGIHEERVIGLADLERQLTDGHTARGGKIYFVSRLNKPARRGKHLVNLHPGFFLWSHLRCGLRKILFSGGI
jgi:hypothetical protein